MLWDIDEAQFFDDEIVRVCNDLANQESVLL
jgi:thymidine kinase